MNDSILEAIVGDDYTDALTLGPEPGIMDSCDVIVESADVLMQFAVGQTGNVYWLDREYTMRPGTRHVENICGVRFRNRIAGAQAKVSCALAGPATPRLAPVVPIAGAGIGDPLLSLSQYPLGLGDVTFGPFDVGDWRALRVALEVEAGVGARLNARYQPQALADEMSQRVSCWNGGGLAAHGMLVCENLAEEVLLELVGADAATVVSLDVAPCGLNQQARWDRAANPGVLIPAFRNGVVVGAGGTQTIVVNGFFGIGQTIFRGLTGGPYNVTIDQLDHTGVAQGRLLDQQATQAFTQEHPLVPSTMLISVTNTAGVAGTYNLSTVVKGPA